MLNKFFMKLKLFYASSAFVFSLSFLIVGNVFGDDAIKGPDLVEEELLVAEVSKLIKNKDFANLEAMAESIRRKKSYMLSGRNKLAIFYEAIDQNIGNRIPDLFNFITILNEWKEAFPKSVTVDAAYVEIYTRLAWAHRGGGYSSAISKSSFENMTELLENAWEICNRALETKAQDSSIYANCIQTGMGLDLSREEVDKMFSAGFLVDPTYHRLYTRMIQYLLPKWHGSEIDVIRFIEQITTHTKAFDKDVLYARLAIGLRLYDGDNVGRYELSWERLKHGFESLRREFPQSSYILNNYCWYANYFKDYPLAKSLFDLIGDRSGSFSEEVWSKEYFDQARKAANGDKKSEAAMNFFRYISRNDNEGFIKFLSTNPDINLRGAHGRVPLILALVYRELGMANMLIDAGCDLSITDDYGYQAIHYAAKKDAPSWLIEKLIKKGVDLNAQIKEWFTTPLHLAAEEGSYAALKYLLTLPNINVNALNKLLQTPLYTSAREGRDKSVELLLQHSKVKADATDSSGYTPLSIAVYEGHTQVVKLLLARDKSHQRTHAGMSPLDIARDNKQEDMIALLIENGADSKAPHITKDKASKAIEINSRGDVLLQSKKYEEARKLYQQAYELNPFYANVNFNFYRLAYNLDRDLTKADQYLSRAIELRSDFGKWYYFMGRIRLDQNRTNDAMANFRIFIEKALKEDEGAIQELYAEFPQLKNNM